MIQTDSASLENTMTARGIKPSPVRILILRALAEAGRPLSSQDLETRLDTVDRSSITRTLSLFSDRHMIHKVDDGSGSTKYELCLAHDHNHGDKDLHPHFHCLRCGITYCLDTVAIPKVPLPEGFEPATANYVIKGLCPKCANTGK